MKRKGKGGKNRRTDDGKDRRKGRRRGHRTGYGRLLLIILSPKKSSSPRRNVPISTNNNSFISLSSANSVNRVPRKHITASYLDNTTKQWLPSLKNNNCISHKWREKMLTKLFLDQLWVLGYKLNTSFGKKFNTRSNFCLNCLAQNAQFKNFWRTWTSEGSLCTYDSVWG